MAIDGRYPRWWNPMLTRAVSKQCCASVPDSPSPTTSLSAGRLGDSGMVAIRRDGHRGHPEGTRLRLAGGPNRVALALGVDDAVPGRGVLEAIRRLLRLQAGLEPLPHQVEHGEGVLSLLVDPAGR